MFAKLDLILEALHLRFHLHKRSVVGTEVGMSFNSQQKQEASTSFCRAYSGLFFCN